MGLGALTTQSIFIIRFLLLYLAAYYLWDILLVDDESVLQQEGLHLVCEEVLAEVVGEADKVCDELAGPVAEDGRHSGHVEVLGESGSRADNLTELGRLVITGNAAQALQHGLAAGHSRLVDENDDGAALLLVVHGVQEMLTVRQADQLTESKHFITILPYIITEVGIYKRKKLFTFFLGRKRVFFLLLFIGRKRVSFLFFLNLTFFLIESVFSLFYNFPPQVCITQFIFQAFICLI